MTATSSATLAGARKVLGYTGPWACSRCGRVRSVRRTLLFMDGVPVCHHCFLKGPTA